MRAASYDPFNSSLLNEDALKSFSAKLDELDQIAQNLKTDPISNLRAIKSPAERESYFNQHATALEKFQNANEVFNQEMTKLCEALQKAKRSLPLADREFNGESTAIPELRIKINSALERAHKIHQQYYTNKKIINAQSELQNFLKKKFDALYEIDLKIQEAKAKLLQENYFAAGNLEDNYEILRKEALILHLAHEISEHKAKLAKIIRSTTDNFTLPEKCTNLLTEEECKEVKEEILRQAIILENELKDEEASSLNHIIKEKRRMMQKMLATPQLNTIRRLLINYGNQEIVDECYGARKPRFNVNTVHIFTGCNFSHIKLTNLQFPKLILDHSNFSHAVIRGCQLPEEMIGVNLNNAVIDDCVFGSSIPTTLRGVLINSGTHLNWETLSPVILTSNFSDFTKPDFQGNSNYLAGLVTTINSKNKTVFSPKLILNIFRQIQTAPRPRHIINDEEFLKLKKKRAIQVAQLMVPKCQNLPELLEEFYTLILTKNAGSINPYRFIRKERDSYLRLSRYGNTFTWQQIMEPIKIQLRILASTPQFDTLNSAQIEQLNKIMGTGMHHLEQRLWSCGQLESFKSNYSSKEQRQPAPLR